LLQVVADFIEEEAKNRLPGLFYDLVVSCPRCVSQGHLAEAHMFQWETEWERLAKGEIGKLFCEKCDKSIRVEVGAEGRKEIHYPKFKKEICNEFDTKMLSLPENTVKDVGELSLDTVDNPRQKWPMSKVPYIFLSHTGRDGVKEEIARPTYWFLTKILGVRAFLDDLSLLPGDKVTEALMPRAYECSHALVILSPKFRERKFCVRELNTFMARRRVNDGIRVLPALWLIENVDGYHSDVDDIIWIGNRGIKSCVKYLVEILWPALIVEFAGPTMTRQQLKDHLVDYVKEQTGRTHAIPPELADIAI